MQAAAVVAGVSLAGCASPPSSSVHATAAASSPSTVSPTPAAVHAVQATPGTATTRIESDDGPAGFRQWRNTFSARALAAGIRPETVGTALANAQWQPRVVELDRSQPEFTRTPWAYLDSAVSAQRIAQGRAQLEQHRATLEAAARRYGVPASIITAIWGMESNYGTNFGSFRAVDALATLAHEGRRRAWAESELLAALRILDQGDIAAERMVGSWAGAMGHTQFLPSVFLAHAVDADGDGHRDIWGSIPDVAASTANFLARSGWQAASTWGSEVVLPSGFDHGRADPAVRQSAARWEAEGLRAPEGQALPALADAYIITPAGARGPAFLVGENFRAILRYNNSVSYALAVGLLARQIEGGSGVATPWPRDLAPLSRAQLQAMQEALNRKGFAAGTPDGVMGPATRAGLRGFQRSIGLPPDGYPTLELLQRLQASPAS
ncbi:MAG: lytic murein transglycosylase [Acidovorax sp.]|uniref:lytic murein transglycosylase n=1 Tax=Acidovorax sp. TaxID=1872122 RepID=UPI00262BD718|nr:lytic murein transglycosylase [Acidovorax sp.]MDH4426940.1 lytic murein transglycosylase [Acidovorax sp.]